MTRLAWMAARPHELWLIIAAAPDQSQHALLTYEKSGRWFWTCATGQHVNHGNFLANPSRREGLCQRTGTVSS
jgi:hypothetical protein